MVPVTIRGVTLRTIELAHQGNEASDLLPVDNQSLLDAHGWTRGFWTVLDEGAVEDSIAVLGQRAADDGWEIHRLRAEPDRDDGRTEDAEACARHDGWVYVVGSHYGSKGGPLQPRRAFIARFHEAEIDREVPDTRIPLQVRRNSFRLHRIVNDALDAAAVVPITPGDGVRERFIARTIERGVKRDKGWRERLASQDVPVNIEGAAFRPDGALLLALRFPTTASGEPIVVELTGVPAMFEADDAWPTAHRVWVLEGATPAGALTGFRALSHAGGDVYDAIVGSIDATGKGSALLEDHPEGGDIHCTHWRFSLPPNVAGGPVAAELVRDFPELRNVEGLSHADGHDLYVTDEDHRIQVRLA